MKTWLKVLIIVLVVAALAVGGILIYRYVAGNQEVAVERVQNYMLTWMPNQSYIYGNVVSDGSQMLVKDPEKEVLEVFVQQGDTVRIGDPLVRYDATLDQLKLDEKLLEREKAYRDLQQLYAEYKDWARTEYPEKNVPTHTPVPAWTATPDVKAAARRTRLVKTISESGGTGTELDPIRYTALDSDPIPMELTQNLLVLAAEQMQPRFAVVDAVKFQLRFRAMPDGKLSFRVTMAEDNPKNTDFNTPISGDGTEDDPYRYFFAAGKDVPDAFLAMLRYLAETREADVYTELTASGFSVKMVSRADGAVSLAITVIEPTPTPSPSPTPSETPEPTNEPYYGPSRAEREEYARRVAQQIRQKEVAYRQLNLDIAKLELEGADGIVRSKIDGTVTQALDPSSVQRGEVYLAISGGSGMHVVSVIGEMDLEQYPVGTEMTGYSYQSASEIPVVVREISTMPYSTNYSNGGNPNSSGYLVRMDILGDVMPSNGEFIEFTFRPGAQEEMNYLFEAFIREIDGEDCIFLVRDGKLQKTVVKTGKRIDNYIEILNVKLMPEDYIAFPYGSNVRDGAPAKIPSESDTMIIW